MDPNRFTPGILSNYTRNVLREIGEFVLVNSQDD